ncbi:hypothetical protein JCM11251_006449 [Rhodosporidiobolus azoricus]
MAAPRRRQPSTFSSWPVLSLFAIYSARPLLDPSQLDVRLDDATLEAAKVLLLVAPGEVESLSRERQGRLMGTVLGVAGFTATFGAQGATGTMAVHSSKRRMIWLEAEPGFFIHATVALPRSRRHSRRASSATTSSAASAGGVDAASSGLDDSVLLASLRQGYREYRLLRGSITGTLRREGKDVVKKEIEDFWHGWVEKWDLGGGAEVAQIEQVLDAVPRCALLTPHTSAQIYPLLAQFAASNPSMLPILLHSTAIVSIPSLTSKSSSGDSDATPTKASNRAASPPLTEDDLLALIRVISSVTKAQKILSIRPDLPNTPFPPAHPLADSSLSPLLSPDTNSPSSSSRWSAPFDSLTNGMSSLLGPRPLSNVSLPSLPSMPSFPGLSSTAADTASSSKKDLRAGFKALRVQEGDAAAERRQEEEAAKRGRKDSSLSVKRDSTAWSFRSVSWGKFGLGGKDDAKESVTTAGKAQPALESTGVEASVEPSSAAARPPSPSASDAIKTPADDDTQLAPADTGLPSGPTAPAVELAPVVDVGELAEAIGASPAVTAVDLPPSSPKIEGMAEAPGEAGAGEQKDVNGSLGAEKEGKQGVEKKLDLFCGVGDSANTRFTARLYRRGLLTLALAHLPFTASDDSDDVTSLLDSRAERLLEAMEAVLEVVVPPRAPYPHRHIVKHGIMTSSQGAPTETTAAEEAEASAALLEAYRGVDSSSPTLESLTRLSTSQWVVHRRSLDPSSPFSPSSSLSSVSPVAATHPTDVYAILPAKTTRGKDASLLDAADELRKVARAYYG